MYFRNIDTATASDKLAGRRSRGAACLKDESEYMGGAGLA
jgi:hypothetical protein